MSELTFFTATQLAAMIRERQVSAVEVLEAHLDQIARHNPRLNAIVTLDKAAARERARQADAALVHGEVWGALHGVPVTVKDAFETAGLRTTSGYKPWANYVPLNDAPAVARLSAVGRDYSGQDQSAGPCGAALNQSTMCSGARTIRGI